MVSVRFTQAKLVFVLKQTREGLWKSASKHAPLVYEINLSFLGEWHFGMGAMGHCLTFPNINPLDRRNEDSAESLPLDHCAGI